MVESAPFIRFFISCARHLLTDFADLVFSKSLKAVEMPYRKVKSVGSL